MLKGHCLCGAVRIKARSTSRDPAVCHCGQCRRQSGHLWASVQVPDGDLEVRGPVRWFDSSPGVRRGFCPACGSVLFWKSVAEPDTGVSLGCPEAPTGLRVTRHIFTADKGDYYDLPPGADPR